MKNDALPSEKSFKVLMAILIIIIMAVLINGCNMQIVDTKWSFDYAYIDLGNGNIIEGHVDSWKDWNDSDMIQVTMFDGKTYFTHSSNVVLIKSK